MTVGGRTEEVKSAVYAESPAGEGTEPEIGIYLLKDVVTGPLQEQPDFAITILISQSLLGKTHDLTKSVGTSTLSISGVDGMSMVTISHQRGAIDVIDSSTPDLDLTVTSGTLHMTRSGDKFTIKLSATLSNGKTISADWEGRATLLDL